MSKLFYLERIKVLNRSKIKIKQTEENNNHCVRAKEEEKEKTTRTTTMVIVVRFEFAQRDNRTWNAIGVNRRSSYGEGRNAEIVSIRIARRAVAHVKHAPDTQQKLA